MEGEERSNTNNNDNINNNDNNLNIDGNINSESDDKNNINNNSITENIPEKIEENKEDNEKDENISNNNNKNNLENKENEQEIEKEIAKKDLENNEEDLTKNEPEKDEEKEEKDEKDEKDEIEIDINNKSPPDLSKPENIVFSPSLRTEAKHPTSSSPSDVTFINTLLQSNQEDEIIYSSGEFSNFSPYSSSEMATSSLRPSSLTKNSEKASTESSNIGQSLPTSPSRKLRDKSVVLDPQMVEQIEQNARNLAQNVDHLIGSLSSSLHAVIFYLFY